MVTDPRTRHQLFRAIEEAGRTQDADPAYVAELAAWSGRARGARDGVPADRAPTPGGVPGRMPMRAFAGEAAPGPATGEPESAALLLLSTATDTPLSVAARRRGDQRRAADGHPHGPGRQPAHPGAGGRRHPHVRP